MSKIEVNTVAPQCGTTLTLGESGDTVVLGTGASQSGFGRNGAVNWQTTKKTTSFTAVSGEGYFCDTAASGAFTLTLPSSPSAGDIVGLKDYNGNFGSDNLTVNRNGSPLNGSSTNFIAQTNNLSLTIVYVDSTEGWVSIEEGTGFVGEAFVTATGGTVSCSGNCRIHTFTGPGTFCVSSVASCTANNVVSYVVVAGGGGGGSVRGSGGGAGGYREGSTNSVTPYTASPLSNPTGLTVVGTAYPITVGAGGTGGTSCGCAANIVLGSNGGNSIFSSITSAGGGRGTSPAPSPNTAGPGGSGGGGNENTGSGSSAGGTGNQPPVSPPQGTNGGSGVGGSNYGAGGGGGATVAGTNGDPTGGGAGGAGATSSINGTPTTRAGGGGGSVYNRPDNFGAGGSGGGGAAVAGGGNPAATAGTANTGGGGGGGYHPGNSTKEGGAAGGSGIVIIRYKYQ